MILHPADRQGLHLVFACNASEIRIKTPSQLGRNKFAPLFCCENTMHQTTDKRVQGGSPFVPDGTPHFFAILPSDKSLGYFRSSPRDCLCNRSPGIHCFVPEDA